MKNAVASDLHPMVSAMEMTPLASIDPPHVVKNQVVLHKLIVFPLKLLQEGVQNQVDGSAAVDEHLGDRPFIDVTSNIQWLYVLARLLGLLEHNLLRAETHLNDLLLDTPELGWQHENHVGVHAGWW
jgi:hypothetical protein